SWPWLGRHRIAEAVTSLQDRRGSLETLSRKQPGRDSGLDGPPHVKGLALHSTHGRKFPEPGGSVAGDTKRVCHLKRVEIQHLSGNRRRAENASGSVTVEVLTRPW